MKKKIVILSLILMPVVLLLLLFGYSYYRNLPKNIHISNISSDSATISWVTRKETTGLVVIEENISATPIKLGGVKGATYYDDRDVNNAQIQFAKEAPEGTLLSYSAENAEVEEKGAYYTHHVTIKDLVPEKEYYFRVGNGTYYFAGESVENGKSAFITTKEEKVVGLNTPDPSYGKIISSNKNVEAVDDAIIYLEIVDSSTGETSSLISTPASDLGSWFLDLNKALNSEGDSSYMSGKEYDPNNLYHRAEIVLNPKDMYVTNIPIDHDAPSADMVLENLMAVQNVMGVSTTSEPPAEDNAIDKFLDTFESTVSDKLIFKSYAICCESIQCSDGTTFSRDVHTPHKSCEARAEEGCWNHGGVSSQGGACDASDLPEASSFCLSSCGIDSNKDGKLASYEANFDIRGQWCECCNADCGGGFDCKQDRQYSQCGGGSSSPGTPSGPGGSTPPGGNNGPGGSDPSGPGGSSPGSPPSPGGTTDPGGSTDPGNSIPPSGRNGHLPLMIRWWNYQPEFGQAYLYARASQTEIDGMAAVTGGHTKMLMVFSLGELNSWIGKTDELNSKGITVWGYNTEQGAEHTPPEEFATINSGDPNVNAVAKFAKIATDNGFEAIWGPTRHKLDAASNEALAAMFQSGITNIAMQEQKFIENSTASARLAAVRQTIERYDRIAAVNGVSDVKYHVQIMETRCPNLQNCVDFVQGLEAIPVDSIAIWANRGIGKDFVSAIRGGSTGTGGGEGTYYPQENSPYENASPDNDPSTCTYNGAKYQHGYSFYEGLKPIMYCHGGVMREIQAIELNQSCPAGKFCYCKESDLMLTEDDTARECETRDEIHDDKKGLGYNCESANACSNRKAGFNGCVDIHDKKFQLNCSADCQESWSPCDEEITTVEMEQREINVQIEEKQIQFTRKAYAEDSKDKRLQVTPKEGLVSFPQTGRYCTFYENETYCFDITTKKGNLLFIDTNDNGIYDEDVDINIGNENELLEVTAEEVDSIYAFKKGLNFISFNHIPQKSDITASGFLAGLNSGEQEHVYSLAKYDTGNWVVVGDRDGVSYRSEDFMLIPGVGYLLNAVDDFEVRLKGSVIIEPVPVYMHTGWNLIGVNGMYESDYSAESIINSVSEVKTLDVDNITRWLSDTSQFDSVQLSSDEEGAMQTYGFDFPLNTYEGYFVRVVDGGGEWVPE